MIETKKGIMVLKKWQSTKNCGGTVSLRASCTCESEDHDINMWIEYDRDFELTQLRFFINMDHIDPYSDRVGPGFVNGVKGRLNIVRNMLSRIGKAVRLVFTGEIKVNGDFVFDDEEQIKDFANTLIQSIQYIRESENKRSGSSIM